LAVLIYQQRSQQQQNKMQAMHAAAGPSRAAPMSRRASVRVHAAKPVVMVNSCTGKMGKAVADAAVRAGLTLAPYTLCSEGEAGGNVEVAGQQLQLVGPSTRDKVIEQVRAVAASANGIHSPLLFPGKQQHVHSSNTNNHTHRWQQGKPQSRSSLLCSHTPTHQHTYRR
jgi:hypothetical protein